MSASSEVGNCELDNAAGEGKGKSWKELIPAAVWSQMAQLVLSWNFAPRPVKTDGKTTAFKSLI